MKLSSSLLVLIVFLAALPITSVFAIHLDNKGLTIENTGFAITDTTIKTSQISITAISQKGTISSTNLSIEDGFVTLNDSLYSISKATGSLLHDGKYIRINGILSDTQEIGTVSLFGKLIHESNEGLVYSVTGKIVSEKISYKVVYTSKISSISTTSKTSSETTIKTNEEVKILKGASNKGNIKYLSDTRSSVTPDTTITFINEDVTSHTLLSGRENYGDRYNPFTADGRINTGEIPAGSSKQVTFDKTGFYRIFDPDYPWINKIYYVFPASESQVIRQGSNQQGN